ncbi:protein kinase domain-containing protein [Demequina sp. SO4-13]|uniref:protein kinase domain-containing protein n=1 Tax=Demequina sp. SO4-13 TaxID=3401027 RepID=UPI003AF8E6D5
MSSEQAPDARVVTRAVGTGPEVLARVTDRVRSLREVTHKGVLVPSSVGVASGDQVVVTVPWLEGVDLAELETRRGPLSAGECVWLGVRIAAALEELHRRGIAHGDVAPANVVVANGRVVIVDTVGGCLDDERGTVGFRAPERAAGATAAGDAYSLGALLRWCVTDRDSIPIEAWTAPLVVGDPGSRPPVDVAARALASCAREEPVTVPQRSEVVSAVRARASERTERIASGRSWRLRRIAVRVGAGVGLAAIAAAGVVAVPRLVDSIAPESAAAATGVPLQAPERAAADLTSQRIDALASGDGEGLMATVGDGPLAGETAELARRLDEGLARYEGLEVEVRDVAVTEHSGKASTATVRYAVTDHHIVTPEGSVAVPGYEQRVELELRWDGRWTVARARPLS